MERKAGFYLDLSPERAKSTKTLGPALAEVKAQLVAAENQTARKSLAHNKGLKRTVVKNLITGTSKTIYI